MNPANFFRDSSLGFTRSFTARLIGDNVLPQEEFLPLSLRILSQPEGSVFFADVCYAARCVSVTSLLYIVKQTKARIVKDSRRISHALSIIALPMSQVYNYP